MIPLRAEQPNPIRAIRVSSRKEGITMNMRTFALAALSTVLLVAALASGDSGTEGDEKAIRSLIARMMEDWNKHDIKSFISHFTEDSDAVTRVGQWLRGPAEHEAHLTQLHASAFRDQLIGRTSRVDDIRFIAPNVAVAHEIVEEKTGKSIRTYFLSKKREEWKVESATISVIASPGEYPGHIGQGASASAIVDTAVKALGGSEKLSKIQAATWKTSGTISFGGSDSKISTEWTVMGLDHLRLEFEGIFGGSKVKGINVVAGERGWRKFGDNEVELDNAAVADLKRHAYLAVIQNIILPIKGPEFKLEAFAEEVIGGKPATVIRAIGPDGKDFKLYFDKGTGLPSRLVASVADFDGNTYTQETTFSDYKEMDGIKKATRIELKRDGARFQEHQLTEFRILDKIDPKVFSRPE
jgi:uncharacterized protein (TIGR02246 family)